jgi:YD repeat-containing protein
MNRLVQGRRSARLKAASVKRRLSVLTLAGLTLFASLAHAQSGSTGVEAYEEFGKRLRAAQEVTPLTSDLFGDHVSLYNGSVEFAVTDIDIPGNAALPVRFGRRLEIEDRRLPTGHLGGLGDWDLEVPYIDGVFTREDGWTVQGTPYTVQSYNRCSLTNVPYMYRSGTSDWAPPVFVWDGNQMHIPNVASEELLKNTEVKLPAVGDGGTYPWVTKSFYRVSCLGSTANGYPGEAFVVLTPSGVRYTFNWVAVNNTSDLIYNTAGPTGGSVKTGVQRDRIFMLATQVVDRFGNWVKYNYSGNQLTSITASDGREIDITWSGGLVQSATAISPTYGSRTWSYGYTNGNLSSVTQPDGSKWTYAIVSGSLQTTKVNDTDPNPYPVHCQLEPDGNTGGMVYAITSPSGATGTFNFTYARHYRTDVPQSCLPPTNPLTNYPLVYRYFDNFTLTSKQITGAGIGTQTWSYGYQEPPGGYYTAASEWVNTNETYIPPGDCNGCIKSKVVVVTEPGDIIRYTFGTAYARNEGWLLQTETDALDGTVKKVVTNTYLTEDQVDAQPFAGNAGAQVQPSFKNPMTNRIRPVTMTTTVQDGDTYTHQIEAFDVFAQPELVKRYNSIAGQPSIEERTTYLNDLPHWVLGLVQQVDNLTTGETESNNMFDLSNVTLTSKSRFGVLLKSYTYNAQGQVASVKDGRNYTTTVSNYMRGIPQTINYPDGKSQSLVVDDFGDIRSVTDQASYTTSYDYDSLGHITKITYPANDEQPWYPKSFAYDVVGGSERGLNGTHWRLTVTKGDSVNVTYFDALLRPLLADTYIGIDPNSHITVETSYDWKGRKTFAAFPISGSPNIGATAGTHTTYDELDRVTQVDRTSELGTLTSRTAYLSGAKRQVTDPKTYVTTTSYQVVDEPSEDKVILVQAPEGVNQSVARDLYGNPTAIRQWGNFAGQTADLTKQLIYDAQHRLCRTVEPESGSEVVHYDAASNIDWLASGLSFGDVTACHQSDVADAAKTTYTYDEMNRVHQILPPAGTQSTTFQYDPLGNKNYAASGTSVWSANRNKLGLITDETLNVTGNGSNVLRYGHDAYGTVRTLTYPDGMAVDYAPDALGRARQAGAYASSVSYFPDGNVQSFLYGNGTQYLAEENLRLLLSNFTYGKSGTLNLSEDLLYDGNGNITNINDLATGQRTKLFGYDGLNRLTSAQSSNLWGTESYTYDTLNNIQTRTTGGQAYTYNYDTANLLRTISANGSTVTSLDYDPRGNVKTKNGNTLRFDDLNQLLQIPGFDSYDYDASGRRVRKTPAGSSQSTFYFYNQPGQLLYQYDMSTTKITDYVYLGKKLIARNETILFPAPASVSFDANPNNGTYTVSWAAATGATSYTLQESIDGGSTWTTVYTGSTLSLAEANRDGGTYAYRVQGCKTGMCTAWTQPATLGVTPAQSVITVPTGIKNGTYTVSWTIPAGTATLDVQEGVNGTWTTIAADTTANSINRPGTTTGSFTYRVVAKNSYGNRGWATSSAVTVDTTYGVVPGKPASITVPTTSSTGAVTVTWSSVPQVTYYVVTQTGPSGNTQAYNGPNTSVALTGLVDGSYTYAVHACNAYNCGGDQTTTSPLVVTHPPASAPTLTTPANNNTGSYTVSWTAVATATYYILQELPSGGAWTQVQSSSSASWGASRGNGTYSYRVEACNAGGCSTQFSAPQTTVVAIPPQMPASISVPATSSGPTTVSWASSPTTTSYELLHSFNGGGWSSVYTGSATSIVVNETVTGSYAYEVRACYSSQCSAYKTTSSTVAVTIPPSSVPSLSVPSTSNNGQYTISWSGVAAATSYQLQEQTNYGGWYDVQNNGSTSWTPAPKNNGAYSYQVRACNAGGCSGWSAAGTVNVSLNMPLPANGQAYWHTYMISTTTGNMSIGFDIVGGNTWEVYYIQPGTSHGVMASGPTPPYAVTVQFTWTLVGVPAGFNDAGGSFTNGAPSQVNVSSNPNSWYTTNSWNNRSGSHARTYQVRVDFFSSTGANISSSTFTVTANTEGAQS